MGFGIEKLIPSISEERNYWLVRSMGGMHYDEFVNNGFIAIGYNEVALDGIKLAASKPEKDRLKELQSIVDSIDLGIIIDEEEKERRAEEKEYIRRYGAPLLLRFYSELKKDDIVVIPSSSEKGAVAFAIIESDVFELPPEALSTDTTNFCQFRKRRKITVIDKASRKRLNPELQIMFNSNHAISNVNSYAEYIDNSVRDFYQKGDTTFLILRVKQEEDIVASNFSLVSDLISVVSDFCEDQGIEFDEQCIKMKVCVQSPGDISIFANLPEYLFYLGVAISFFKGVKFEGWGLDFKTTSGLENLSNLIRAFSEYKDRRQNRRNDETIRKKLESLDIDTPEDIRMLFEEMSKRRNKV